MRVEGLGVRVAMGVVFKAYEGEVAARYTYGHIICRKRDLLPATKTVPVNPGPVNRAALATLSPKP